MAEPPTHHGQKALHLLGFARERDQFGELALGFVGVGEVDGRPGGELMIEGARHRQVLFDEASAEAQERHRRRKTEGGVEVGAAHARAGGREDIL
jgi:hypothetical protein